MKEVGINRSLIKLTKNKMKYLFLIALITLLICGCSRNWDDINDNLDDNELPLVTNGLIAFYPFNGNTNDKSGNNQHGVSANIKYTTDRKDKPEAAAYFDGSGFVKVNGIGQTQSFSISLWYKTIQGGFILKTDNIFMYTDKINNMFMAVWNNSGGTYAAGGNPVYFDNTWHHVVVTHNGDDSRIITYFDGVVRHNRPNSGYFIGNNEEIYIGFGASDFYGTSVTNFIGSIDEVYLFNRAINSTEVEKLYYNPE